MSIWNGQEGRRGKLRKFTKGMTKMQKHAVTEMQRYGNRKPFVTPWEGLGGKLEARQHDSLETSQLNG